MTRQLASQYDQPPNPCHAFGRTLAKDRFVPSTGEPDLSDMLADPIVKMLMSQDGVDATALRRLLRARQGH